MKKQETGIKETAYQLASKNGWALEYEGGLELEGEYLDDADLSWSAPSAGREVGEYVLNISWAESTAYGFVLTRESAEKDAAGSAFGAGVGFALPQQGQTLAEKYFISTVEELIAQVESATKRYLV